MQEVHPVPDLIDSEHIREFSAVVGDCKVARLLFPQTVIMAGFSIAPQSRGIVILSLRVAHAFCRKQIAPHRERAARFATPLQVLDGYIFPALPGRDAPKRIILRRLGLVPRILQFVRRLIGLHTSEPFLDRRPRIVRFRQVWLVSAKVAASFSVLDCVEPCVDF